MDTIRPILFVHSSDEMYGADRMLLEFIAALPEHERSAALVWLPTDVPHGANPLCAELARRGIAYEHVDLPILRRRYLNPSGLAGLAGRWRAARRRLRALDPQWLVAATSAVLPLVMGLGRRTNMPVVLHMQEIWDNKEARVLGAMAHRVDHVVAISDSSRRACQDTCASAPQSYPTALLPPAMWRHWSSIPASWCSSLPAAGTPGRATRCC